MTADRDSGPADRAVPPGGIQILRIDGNGNNVVQAGGHVVVLPPEALVPVAEVAASPELGNRRRRPDRFVGRVAELDRLNAALDSPGPVVVAAVHGLGGVGKTTLVEQWAAAHADRFALVRWIMADSPTAIQQGLANLATALQPALARALPVNQLAERGLQWLACHDGWLLVLDNVVDPQDIDEVLDRTSTTGGQVIITSRLATEWQQPGLLIRVDVLDPAESLALLKSIVTAKGTRDLDGVAELCTELGHLPLAIEQVGAYLARNAFLTPRAYLALLTDSPAELLKRGGAKTDPERTLARIWHLTLDRIAINEEAPFAVELLQVLAWYASDNIPITLVSRLADPETMATAVGVLTDYNMITDDPATGTISVHRLVQTVTRTADPTDPHRTPEAVSQARDRATAALAAAFPDDWNEPVTWPAWRALLPHAGALVDNVPPDADTATIAIVLNCIAIFFGNQGFPARAIPLLERALTDTERILGDDHPQTLTACHNLATAYRDAGDLTRAIPLHERAATGRERVLGLYHPETLMFRNNLATAYRDAGDLERAIALLESTVGHCVILLGDDHPDTLAACHNLARSYQEAGDLRRAILLHKRTLTDRERLLGNDHPHTLDSRHSLANVYQTTGDLERAIPLSERVLSERVRVLGDDHPKTLDSRNDLAIAYIKGGNLSQAIPLLERTLTDRERVLGTHHPDALCSRDNLARAYLRAENYSRAIPLLERILADRERVLGTHHPDALCSRNDLAMAYVGADNLSRAIPLYETALADSERIFGNNHPQTKTARRVLALARELDDLDGCG